MNAVTSYILNVTAAAVVVSILLTLAGGGSMAHLAKMLAGIFMTLVVVSPVVNLEIPDPERWISDHAQSGREAAAMGEELANDAAHTFIKSRVETYILDKAALYGAPLQAEVSLDSDGIPVSVTLRGAVSAYARSRLSRIITEDLGLGEEAQQWLS